MTFSPDGDDSVLTRVSEFEVFSKGSSPQFVNMFHGQTQQLEIALFEFSHIVGAGDERGRRWKTVISFNSPSLNLPRFTLRPEWPIDKLKQFIGFEDIDFDSHPFFSRKCKLLADDEEATRRVFTEEVLDHLEQMFEQDGMDVDALFRSTFPPDHNPLTLLHLVGHVPEKGSRNPHISTEISIEASGSEFIYYCSQRYLPEQMHLFLEEGFAVYHMFQA